MRMWRTHQLVVVFSLAIVILVGSSACSSGRLTDRIDQCPVCSARVWPFSLTTKRERQLISAMTEKLRCAYAAVGTAAEQVQAEIDSQKAYLHMQDIGLLMRFTIAFQLTIDLERGRGFDSLFEAFDRAGFDPVLALVSMGKRSDDGSYYSYEAEGLATALQIARISEAIRTCSQRVGVMRLTADVGPAQGEGWDLLEQRGELGKE